MVTTTFAAVALSAVLSPSLVVAPTWQSDYSKALTTATDQKKPLAVFIGHGDGGYAKLVAGEIPADAGQLLAKNYVCVYIDTDTAEGKSLAGKFELSNGLVISSDANVQALRHTGAVAPTDLSTYLTRYSDPTRVVLTTENTGAVVSSPVVSAGVVYSSCANGQCGGVTSYRPTHSFRPSFGNSSGFSTCPNGRCPNAR